MLSGAQISPATCYDRFERQNVTPVLMHVSEKNLPTTPGLPHSQPVTRSAQQNLPVDSCDHDEIVVHSHYE